MGSEEKSKLGLTEAQRTAVEHGAGPMLVLAGAGCGKTRVLTERIAHLLRSGACRPDEILAVTFTINAAAEIRSRVKKMLPEVDCSRLKATTFHAYCANLLASTGRSFAVVDDIDLAVYLRQHIAELPLRLFTRAASPAQFIEQLMKFNARCQDELVSAADYSAYIEELKRLPIIPAPRVAKTKELSRLSRDEAIARCEEIAAVYEHVTNLLRSRGWGTFGDQLQQAVDLLRAESVLLENERKKCRFILIDEFQDSNFAQIELAAVLGGSNPNLFVVGDPDQAVYKFRGAAAAGAFEEFKRRYPGCKSVALSDNFRSADPILACAHTLIDVNPKPVTGRGALHASRAVPPLEAGPVEALITSNNASEAEAVAEAIKQRQVRTGQRWKNFAVLYRNHDHRLEVVAELETRGIPVEVIGADLTESSELRDLLGAARAVAMPDDSVALLRTAALPCFTLDPEELRRAMASAERNTPLLKTLKTVEDGSNVLRKVFAAKADIAGKDAQAALELIQQYFQLRGSEPTEQLKKFAASWLDKPTCEDRSLAGFIEYLDLFRACGGKLSGERKVPADAVQLMTVHAAKGLEFAHVFVMRCSKGSFPARYREELFEFPNALSKARFLDPDSQTGYDQEQRRTFYVAMTRARDSLTLCGRVTARGKVHAGYCEELLGSKPLKPFLQRRDFTHASLRIEASAWPLLPIESWVTAPTARWEDGIALSASAIESYKTCPLRFKLERDWKIPAETPASLLYGAAMHLSLKAYFDGVRGGSRPTLAALIENFEDSMRVATISDAHQADLYRTQGRMHLEAFYQSQDGSECQVLATEQWFEIEVQGIRITGRMDRIDSVDQGVHICDYKTGKAKDQKMADRSLQLGIYALAARERGMNAVALSFHNLEDSSVVRTTRTSSDLAGVEKEIVEIGDKIRAGSFEPNRDFHCKSCPYRSICPAHEEKVYSIARTVTTVQ